MMKKMKTYSLLFAFVAMAYMANAQFLFFWKGDHRLALDVGVNTSFFSAKFAGPLANHIVDDVKMTVSPSVGLNWSMEKDFNKKTAFGFYTDFQVTSTHWSVSFGQNSSNNVLYNVKSTTLNFMEGVYFAFDLKKLKRKKKLQALVGAGIYQDLRLKGNVTEEERGLGYRTCFTAEEWLDMARYSMDNDDFSIPFDLDFGIDLLAGIQYRFNENFFVQGRLVYMFPLVGSGSTINEMSSDTDDFGKHKLNPYVWYHNDKIHKIGLVGTIGFRW